MITTYAVEIGIGVVILGMIKYILWRERGLLMTTESHLKECTNAKKEVREGIKEEFKNFKEHFDTEMENKVLKSLHNLNGTLEQKIADVVSAQVTILGVKLTEEINRKLDLVEILKHVVTKE